MTTTLLLLGIAVHRGTASLSGAPVPRGETVVLLHGLMTTTWHMKRIERSLTRQGYAVENWEYDSRHGMIEDYARALHDVVRALPSDQPLHFVGFSLGSLIIRYYLGHYEVPSLGRVVMIGPPNHGSELADVVFPSAWFRALAGSDVTAQLRASNREFFDALDIPSVPVGIIAGGRGDTVGFSDALPGDDDGRVSVESARLDGAEDFIVLPHRHVMLLVANDTLHQVLRFITSGHFDHAVWSHAAGNTYHLRPSATNSPSVAILPRQEMASPNRGTWPPPAQGDSP
ncbi:MAG: lipase family alpha/beta hydrolase [Nitrospirota bacterium]